MKSTLVLVTSVAGAVLAVPQSVAAPAPTASPIWAEVQNDADYRRCLALRPNDPCVREIFYLHGSAGRLRSSCGPQGVLGLRREVFAFDRSLFYPRSLFPDGPKCGQRQTYNYHSSGFQTDAREYARPGSYVRLTPNEYGPICDMCFVDQTLIIDDDAIPDTPGSTLDKEFV